MKGLNKVFIMGYVGNDPELMMTQKGNPYTKLSVATDRYIKNKEGNTSRDTLWHSVFVWGKQSELCAQKLSKGSAVLVEGYLSSYAWESENGDKRKQVAIHADRVEFVPRRNVAESVNTTDS